MASKKESKKKSKTLVLLDAHAIIHRAYHALPDFKSSKGEPTGALYGIVAMLVNILKDVKPEYIAACFDLPKPTFRHEVFKDYKNGRKKTDDALVAQIVRSRDIFKAFNIPVYELEGYEADDLLGTIVEQLTKQKASKQVKKAKSCFAAEKEIDVVIASGDMDTMQLVSGKRVQVYTLRKGVKDTIMYDEKAVKERFGFGPELLPDYKGLRGDPSDNIPGIKGIGEKTATTLIAKYGSLDNIYKALDKLDATDKEALKKVGLTPRTLGLLQEGKDEAYFSKMLATIVRDVPVTYKLPTVEWLESVTMEPVFSLLSELELRTLVPRVKTLLGADEEEQEVAQELASISKREAQEVGIMLWLIKSDITNPTVDDIMQFTGAANWAEAKQNISTLLKERELDKVFNKIEKPLISIVEQMNKTGIMLDTAYLKGLSKEYSAELAKIEKEIYKMAGVEFNIKSPKQLGEVLFDKLGLKSKKKTASGQYSTNEKELHKLAAEHPIINKVFDYRELQKLLSTYIDNLPKMVEEEARGGDGRLHTQFLQAGTTTGRMASQQPNLQNIPTKSEHGRRVRKAFVAPKGRVLVALDYSQIELRIAAVLSDDEKLLGIFKSGGDIHSAVAGEVFNVPVSEVTPEMRRRAKVINFGILYGMGVNALRANLQEGLQEGDQNITQKDARAYLDKYFKSFSDLAQWIDNTKSEAQRLGYTTTLFGRKRYFEGLSSKLPFVRAAAERMAVNAPVQGSSADVTKLAMIAVDKYLQESSLQSKVQLILQVHDELIYEMPEDDWQDYTKEIDHIMEAVAGLPVATPVEAKVGQNWAELKPVELNKEK